MAWLNGKEKRRGFTCGYIFIATFIISCFIKPGIHEVKHGCITPARKVSQREREEWWTYRYYYAMSFSQSFVQSLDFIIAKHTWTWTGGSLLLGGLRRFGLFVFSRLTQCCEYILYNKLCFKPEGDKNITWWVQKGQDLEAARTKGKPNGTEMAQVLSVPAIRFLLTAAGIISQSE